MFRCFLCCMPTCRFMAFSCKGHLEISITDNLFVNSEKTFTCVGDFSELLLHTSDKKVSYLPPSPICKTNM